MNKKIEFEKELDDVREEFKKMDSYREAVVYCNKIIEKSDMVVERINKTIEANVFIIIRYTLFFRMIVELRKIFEKSNGDKKSNIDSMVKFIDSHRDELVLYHYERAYNIKRDLEESLRKEIAEKSEKQCRALIEELIKEWEMFFTEENLSVLRNNRDFRVHSFSSTYVVKKDFTLEDFAKYLDAAQKFISKIYLIIDRSNYSYEAEESEWLDAADKFWSRIS